MVLFGFLGVYGLGLVFVATVAVVAFWRDETTPNTHLISWVVLILASLFWPVTLPSILRALRRQQAAQRQQRQQNAASQTAQASSSFAPGPQMER